VVSLVKDFEEVVDTEKAEEDAERMLKGKFDMGDFLEQIRTLQKMGDLKDVVDKLPFFPDGLPEGMNVDERELVKIEAIISSMTKQERNHPELFVVTSFEQIRDRRGRKKGRRQVSDYNLSRVRRVAAGCGQKESEVKQLLVKFGTMRQMMMALGSQSGLLGKIPGFKNLAKMKQMAGMDMEGLMQGMGQFAGGPGGGLPTGSSGAKPKTYGRAKQSAKKKKKRKKARKDRKRTKRKKR